MPNKPAWSPQSPDLSQPVIQHHQPPPLSLEQSWDRRASSYEWPPQPVPQQYETFHTPAPSHAPAFYPSHPQHPPQPPYQMKQEEQPWSPHAHSMQHFQPDVKMAVPTSAAPRSRVDTRGVDVKTKFPTARIKRIMQADEDVGKVAQVTPVVMAKALELFMIRLITSSSDVAKARNSKRVQTAHMKAFITQDEQFDFLRDIVGKVPDAPQKKAAAADSDDSDAEAAAAPKRRKKSTAAGASKGKKRRGSDDD